MLLLLLELFLLAFFPPHSERERERRDSSVVGLEKQVTTSRTVPESENGK